MKQQSFEAQLRAKAQELLNRLVSCLTQEFTFDELRLIEFFNDEHLKDGYEDNRLVPEAFKVARDVRG